MAFSFGNIFCSVLVVFQAGIQSIVKKKIKDPKVYTAEQSKQLVHFTIFTAQIDPNCQHICEKKIHKQGKTRMEIEIAI